MTNAHGAADEDVELLVQELRLANARLAEESLQSQHWASAIAEVTTALVSGDDEHILSLIAERSAGLVGADFVSVITPRSGTEQYVVRAVHGEGTDWIRGRVLELDETLAPTAIAQRTAVILSDVGTVPEFGPIGPIVMMPMLASGAPIGVLSVGRRPGSPPFRETELAMVSEFGRQASVAVELARAQADSRRLELMEERNRIARDLHDHVIQRLFAAGLSLAHAAETTDAPTATTISAQVDAIDAAIGDIRNAVSTLRTRSTAASESLRVRVMQVVNTFESAFDTPPRFRASGPVDLYVPDDVGHEVIAVVRELLSNVAQHAKARSCTVELALRTEVLSVTVTDDGRGIDAPSRHSGINNLDERARRLGGAFEISNALTNGTIARWVIPMNTPEEPSA